MRASDRRVGSHTKFQKVRHTRSFRCKVLTSLIYDKGFEKWYQPRRQIQ